MNLYRESERQEVAPPPGPPPVVMTVFEAPGKKTIHVTQGRRVSVPWTDVLARHEDPHPWQGGKEEVPAWTFAVYQRDNRGTKKKHRPPDDPPPPEDERPDGWPVEAGYGLAVDYDDDPQVGKEAIRERWGRWQYAAHSTASHNRPKGSKPAGPRWHVLLPFTRPVTPADLSRIGKWARHPRRGAGIVGAEAEQPARWYFRPVRAPGGYEWDANEGELLDPGLALAELDAWEAEDQDGGEPEPEGSAVDLDREAPLVGELLDAARTKLLARARGEETPITLPWPRVNHALGGGLWPGCYCLVGNTGSGKSQLSLQAALEAAKQGTPVVYFGLELGRVDLVARLLGLVARKKWSHLYLGERPDGGNLAHSEVPAEALQALFDEHGPTLRSIPFRMELGGAYEWDYTRLVGVVRAATEAHGRPPLVVLDYLQLVQSPPGTREELRERIGRAAYMGRRVARDLDAVVLLVSSTAREWYRKLNGMRPKTRGGAENKKGKAAFEEPASWLVGTGKESGEVEFAMDGLFVLVSEPWRTASPPLGGSTIHFGIAKIRAQPAGFPPLGWVPLRFNGGWFSEPERAPAWERCEL